MVKLFSPFAGASGDVLRLSIAGVSGFGLAGAVCAATGAAKAHKITAKSICCRIEASLLSERMGNEHQLSRDVPDRYYFSYRSCCFNAYELYKII
ncbi:hypothetical protein [Camelimonas lactis]|uniref:hypothetical protein n=1 Tax=Camelimonas lactis TaxID=659006 RepID=UPI001FE10F2E|nr:hypothetical protein [Camelimonas lactis]